jgi:hypothetical protein
MKSGDVAEIGVNVLGPAHAVGQLHQELKALPIEAKAVGRSVAPHLKRAKEALSSLGDKLRRRRSADTTVKRAQEGDMTENEIQKLEGEVDRLIAKLDQAIDETTIGKVKQKLTITHDDGEGDGHYQDVSNPSDEANTDDNGDDGEDDGMQKLSNTVYEQENDEDNRPGDLELSQHNSSSNSRHKFEALTDHVANTEGVPKSYAASLARQRYPDVYNSYVNNGGISKRAATTFEDLVGVEIRKGFTPQMAAQRVAQLYGYRALDNGSSSIAKAIDASAEF